MINILKTELEEKVIELAYIKIDVGDVEFKNAITYPNLNKLFIQNLRGGRGRLKERGLIKKRIF